MEAQRRFVRPTFASVLLALLPACSYSATSVDAIVADAHANAIAAEVAHRGRVEVTGIVDNLGFVDESKAWYVTQYIGNGIAITSEHGRTKRLPFVRMRPDKSDASGFVVCTFSPRFADDLANLRAGQKVTFRGKLVRIDRGSGTFFAIIQGCKPVD